MTNPKILTDDSIRIDHNAVMSDMVGNSNLCYCDAYIDVHTSAACLARGEGSDVRSQSL